LYQREKDLHQNKYNTEQYKKELHACVVAPTYNNDVDFRYAWHLESILQQDYSNYRVVIIDDASTDQTSSKIAMHLRWRNVPKDKVILIKNKVHRTAL
jgi:glycosyltransferase involved in cell wall biosynthesis